jgi:hypothetical protein
MVTNTSGADSLTITWRTPVAAPSGTVTYYFYGGADCPGGTEATPFDTETLDGAGNFPDSVDTGTLDTGSYSFLAVYSGDSNYQGSTAACENFTVSPAGTSTATQVVDSTTGQDVPGSTAVTGDGFYDTATVSAVPNQPPVVSSSRRGARELSGKATSTASLPSGTVSYYFYKASDCPGGTDGTSPFDTETLGSGAVPKSTGTGPLDAGSYSFLAVYSGDSNYQGSTAACENFTVVASNTATATQVVDSTTGQDVPGSAAVTGDSFHDTATVSPASHQVKLPLADERVLRGLTAAAQGGASPPSGTVTYYFYGGGSNGSCSDDNPQAATSSDQVTLNADGSVPSSSAVGPLDAGTYSYLAVYSGDTNYQGSTATCEQYTVTKDATATATSLVDEGPLGVTGDSYHDTATVAALQHQPPGARQRQVAGTSVVQGASAPSGTVTYYFFGGASDNNCSDGNVSDATGSDPVTLNANGTVPNSAPTGGLDAGKYSFLAVYSGDINYQGSTSSCEPFTVGIATTVTTTKVVDEGGTGMTGDSFHDTATVTQRTPVVQAAGRPVSRHLPQSKADGISGPGGTLTYTLFAGGCQAATSGSRGRTIVGEPDTVTVTNGAAQPSSSSGALAPGTYSYQAVYNGDSSFAVSTAQCEQFVVTPARLTVTASSGHSSYGGKLPAITPLYTGFIQGFGLSTITTPPTCVANASSSSHVGSYATNCAGAVDPDYSITYVPGTLTVGTAPLVVTAAGSSMIYGGSVPTIAASYSGFVNGDGVSSLTRKPACATAATRTSPAGNYANSCSGAVDPNYAISYRQGNMSVLKAPLLVTAASTFMLAGGQVPPIVPLYSGFVDNQTPASLSARPHCSTSATSNSLVGKYPTSCSGGVDPNYAFSYRNGVLTVGESPGYRIIGGDGGVFDFHRSFVGSVPPPSLGLHIFDFVGMASTRNGYWLVERNGGVFAFGTARYLGSLPGKHIHVDDIAGIAITPDGGGYWIVSSNGTVYPFGDAVSHGDARALGIHNAVAISSIGAGGYWLLTSSGAVYPYGNAAAVGDCRKASSPCHGTTDIVGMAIRNAGGYWLVARDGSVFTFGDARYHGSCRQHGSGCGNVHDVVGIASPDPNGYWMAEGDGNILGFGDAKSYGRCGIAGSPCVPLVRPIVAINS